MLTDVAFDFFGTLVEYDPGKWAGPFETRALAFLAERGARIGLDAFRETLGAVLADHEREARRTCREPHMFEISRAFLARIGLRDASPQLVEGFTDSYMEEWSCSTVPLPGLHDFLMALGERYRLSLISNTFYPPLVHGNLERMGIRHRFAQVITSAELGVRKPDARIFGHALERLGVGPDRIVYVGDSLEADYLGARAAGWTAYLIDPAGRHRDVLENRLEHLFDLSEALAGARAGGGTLSCGPCTPEAPQADDAARSVPSRDVVRPSVRPPD